jgi:hypothetical protein
VKYANAGEHKVPGRHSSNRNKFYKQDSTNCEEIKTTEMVCCVVCVECFRDEHTQLNF